MLNVRSLKCRDHFIQVKQTVLENKFDILTISESWLDNSVTNLELEIPGYDLYRVDRQDKKGGGVCVYILQSYKTEVLWDISGISVAGFHQLWIKVQVRNLRSLVICTAYRPSVLHTGFHKFRVGKVKQILCSNWLLKWANQSSLFGEDSWVLASQKRAWPISRHLDRMLVNNA